MGLILSEGAAPSTPAAGKGHLYLDTTGRLRFINDDGKDIALDDQAGVNVLINGGFDFAQRQVPGTLTTYNSTTVRQYGGDRWGMVNENASIQYQRVDTIAAAEASLQSRFYGRFKKLTSAGKMVVTQCVEALNTGPLRGQQVRVQVKMKYSVAAAMTVRLGLLYLTSAGTTDNIPGSPSGTAQVSAFGAAGTDPTWGTAIVALAPTMPENGTVAGLGLTCVLTSGWVRYGATFTVPTDCKNIAVCVWTNGQPAANDELNMAEASLTLGPRSQAWDPLTFDQELLRCQRYYWKTFGVDQNPTTNVGALTGEIRFPATTATTGTNIWTIHFPIRMFPFTGGVPTTGTLYNPAAANNFARNFTDAADCGATANNFNGDGKAYITVVGSAASAVGEIIGVHASYSAEM